MKPVTPIVMFRLRRMRGQAGLAWARDCADADFRSAAARFPSVPWTTTRGPGAAA